MSNDQGSDSQMIVEDIVLVWCANGHSDRSCTKLHIKRDRRTVTAVRIIMRLVLPIMPNTMASGGLMQLSLNQSD